MAYAAQSARRRPEPAIAAALFSDGASCYRRLLYQKRKTGRRSTLTCIVQNSKQASGAQSHQTLFSSSLSDATPGTFSGVPPTALLHRPASTRIARDGCGRRWANAQSPRDAEQHQQQHQQHHQRLRLSRPSVAAPPRCHGLLQTLPRRRGPLLQLLDPGHGLVLPARAARLLQQHAERRRPPEIGVDGHRIRWMVSIDPSSPNGTPRTICLCRTVSYYVGSIS
jgi:hypothetical protein